MDLYGIDSYPQEFDCSNPTVWKPVPTDYHAYHMEVNPSQPFYLPGQSYSYIPFRAIVDFRLDRVPSRFL